MPARAPTKTARDLTEAYASAPAGAPLRVDAEAGVIHGVKVLGRFSRNRYLAESEGTEYTPAAMRDALPLYEGADVLVDHPADRSAAGVRKDRSTEDVFGQLRNARLDGDAVRADLHYLKAHPMAGRVVEDVTRGLGVFGLSHNAAAGRERFDRRAKRLVIESIAAVRSVDLVRRPATNRNLWESEEPPVSQKTIAVRDLLEGQRKRFSKVRQSWMDRLLEDDGAGLDARVDAPGGDADPDEAMWSGFAAAVQAILDKYKAGDLDAAAATKEVAKYLKTHEKLAGDDEPEEAPEEDDGDEGDGDDEPAPKTESERELDQLRRKDKVRDLCEAEKFAPTKAQLKALCLLESDAERRELIADLRGGDRPGGGPPKGPKSRAPGSAAGPAGGKGKRPLTESAKDDDYDPARALSVLRR